MDVLNPWGNASEWSQGIPPEIHPGDADVLAALVQEVKRDGMVVLEVGSWAGNGSTRIIAEAIRDAGGTLYCVDTWQGNQNVDHHQECCKQHDMFKVFQDNVNRYQAARFIKPLTMSSLEASKTFPDGFFDLIFLDGDHAYSHVKQDVQAWLPKVKRGGILCGHDCEARYADLSAEVKAEIDKSHEDDALKLQHLGHPGLHPGVVKAVAEIFGGRAKLWITTKPSTIWSFNKPAADVTADSEKERGLVAPRLPASPRCSEAEDMVSIIFCSRVKDNPASNVQRLLESAKKHIHLHECGKVEFLIKYDDDDDQRPPQNLFASYFFPIRTFVWSRGEGRHSLHHAQEYLFTQRDPRSRFCLMIADDFYFTRPNFISDILRVKDEFCIMGPIRPPIESFAGIYENEEAVRRWAISFGALAPVVSARLIEVCQNFGWQSNVDGWLMGLSVVLYDLYKTTIWRTIEPFYERGGGHGLGDTPTYNNLELTGLSGPANKYWFELLRRQARNLYLNMEYGTDYKKAGSVPSRLWRKVRAQPLRRLPIRVCRRLLHDIRTALA